MNARVKTPMPVACVWPLSAVVAFAIAAPPCTAQTRLASPDEVRCELAAGDVVPIVPPDGEPTVRSRSLGSDPCSCLHTVRPAGASSCPGLRQRDSTRNGAIIGAGIGAAFGGAMFAQALIVDRNEVDEWAGPYAGATAIAIGIGALVGWAIDASKSKPHVAFGTSSEGRTTVSVQPAFSRRRGIALTLSISR